MTDCQLKLTMFLRF